MNPVLWNDVEPEQRWFVLHTRSRQEKALAQDLDSLQVPNFLPLVHQVRYYGKRKCQVDEPLFPGYIFVRGSREQAFLADRTKRVAQIIEVVDQVRLTWELKNLNIALEQNAPLDPYQFLKTGTRVEVKSGPFRGLQGLVEGRSNWDRLILEVEMLGRAVSLEMHGALLESVE